MGNQNEKFNTQPVETIMEIKPRRVWWKYAVGVSLIVFFIVGGYVVWYQYFSSEAKYSREVEKSALELPAKLEAYKKAREADTYGGKTPEKTLQMFIEALRNEDIELAFKYFALKENNERDPMWMDGLRATKEAGRSNEIVDSLSKIEPYPEGRFHDGDFKFVTRDSNGDIDGYIDLELNQYSGVWKIESL